MDMDRETLLKLRASVLKIRGDAARMNRRARNSWAHRRKRVAEHRKLAEKHAVTCGAKTRTGAPCQAPGNGAGGRCKLHGGKSTGPRTPEGRQKALAMLEKYRPGKGT